MTEEFVGQANVTGVVDDEQRNGQGQATVLAVWNLGPRREIQVLRLENEAHYIYRHDGAMVILKKTSLADYEAESGRHKTTDTKTVAVC